MPRTGFSAGSPHSAENTLIHENAILETCTQAHMLNQAIGEIRYRIVHRDQGN